MNRILTLAVALAAGIPLCAQARTLTVGPSGRQFAQLRDVFSTQNLEPGDVVLVDGGATYESAVMGSDDGGSPTQPVTVRWSGTGATRPKLSGGIHTIKFQGSHHVVFDGFEVTGGSNTCIFNEANDVTVRNALVQGCPAHGILGADRGSGSFTLEYSEVRDTGAGTTKHALYMQSDEVAFPNAVFTMRFNYVHSGNGGNLLKSRHQRSNVHYNWFEGAAYQEIELIGPDCQTQSADWTPALKREDADVVGNVFVHTSSWRNVARLGGDLNGRSNGRVRFLNNTFLIDRAGTANAVLVQLGLEALQMDNNVVLQTGSGAPAIVAENPAQDMELPYCAPFDREPWVSGRRVAGRNNWVETAATAVPIEWGMTRKGSDPGFVNVAQRALRPGTGSPLIDMGNANAGMNSGFEVPGALARAVFDPPLRRKIAPGEARARIVIGPDIDIGALEQVDAADLDVAVNGSRPLLPPADAGGAAASAPASRAARAPSPAGLRALLLRQLPSLRHRMRR